MTIQAHQVAQLLNNVKGATFARVVYDTQVKTAAAHKAVSIRKLTEANVQLFNNLLDTTCPYTNAVKRTAAEHEGNDGKEFVKQGNYFEHTDVYSVVKHKLNSKHYLFAIYNKATSQYTIDGVAADKAAVALYLTPSAAQQLLQPANTVVYNVANDLTHSVTVRTIALESLVELTVQGTTIQA